MIAGTGGLVATGGRRVSRVSIVLVIVVVVVVIVIPERLEVFPAAPAAGAATARVPVLFPVPVFSLPVFPPPPTAVPFIVRFRRQVVALVLGAVT